MKRKLSFLIFLYLIAFLLNFIWEHAHGPLYGIDHEGMSWGLYMWFFFLATLWDAGYITLLYLSIAVMKRRFFWLERSNWLDLSVVMLISFAVATFIEWRALSIGRWSYNDLMPIVPWLDVGLTPFLQLGLLSLLSFWIVGKWWSKKSGYLS